MSGKVNRLYSPGNVIHGIFCQQIIREEFGVAPFLHPVNLLPHVIPYDIRIGQSIPLWEDVHSRRSNKHIYQFEITSDFFPRDSNKWADRSQILSQETSLPQRNDLFFCGISGDLRHVIAYIWVELFVSSPSTHRRKVLNCVFECRYANRYVLGLFHFVSGISRPDLCVFSNQWPTLYSCWELSSR